MHTVAPRPLHCGHHRQTHTVGTLLAWAALLAAPAMARADRMPTGVLWIETPPPDVGGALDRALAESSVLAPISDEKTRKLLSQGGPRSRVEALKAEARERAVAVDLAGADRALANAEWVAGELPQALACALRVELARSRLRYAELAQDPVRTQHAAGVLRACLEPSSPEPPPSRDPDDSALRDRHPPAPTPPTVAAGPRLRIETEPTGATVYVDAALVGRTPLDVDASRLSLGPTTWVEIEARGLRKVQRLGAEAGTLQVSLALEDGLAERIDEVRARHGQATKAELLTLGRKTGADRLLAVRAAGARLEARLLDVHNGQFLGEVWSAEGPVSETAATLVRWMEHPPLPLAERATRRTSLAAEANHRDPDSATAASPPSAFRRWYTWAAIGAAAAAIGGFIVAQNVGDDHIQVHVSH